MPQIEGQMAAEQLRAARDERYRTNVDFVITQTRRVVALGALLWVVASGDIRSAACDVGPLWGARDAIVRACDARPDDGAVDAGPPEGRGDAAHQSVAPGP